MHESYPGDFTRDADFSLPTRRLHRAISDRSGVDENGDDLTHFIEAQKLATALMGDAIAANMFMVGFAWQQGGVPLSRAAIRQAIELNGVAVEFNLAAFEWGRRAAHDPAAVEQVAGIGADARPPVQDLDAVIERRVAFLSDYQDKAYGARYRRQIGRIADLEARMAPGKSGLAMQVAHSLFKLMAIKDEFEVARLYTDGSFRKQMEGTFESWDKIEFHLAPPLLAKKHARTGHLKKQTFGPWMMGAFRLLASMRGLRGSWFDPFSRLAERKWERQLLADYDDLLDTICGKLDGANHETAIRLAGYPDKIRGYGHVREREGKKALGERDNLLTAFLQGDDAPFAEAAE
jgi:indolepyruvate ferredoxin oxidoreductase